MVMANEQLVHDFTKKAEEYRNLLAERGAARARVKLSTLKVRVIRSMLRERGVTEEELEAMQ
jgi:hypothetical protein